MDHFLYCICPHCGSKKDPWFSRDMEDPGYFCADCGMNVHRPPLSDASKQAITEGLADMAAGRVTECNFSQYATEADEESNAT
jgi:DNA-directed RNA polymerase subunit RPC12/RpoP